MPNCVASIEVILTCQMILLPVDCRAADHIYSRFLNLSLFSSFRLTDGHTLPFFDIVIQVVKCRRRQIRNGVVIQYGIRVYMMTQPLVSINYQSSTACGRISNWYLCSSTQLSQSIFTVKSQFCGLHGCFDFLTSEAGAYSIIF